MVQRDTRIDAYIEKSAEFARPILKHLRAVVHEACPDVVETVKWGMPSFEHEGILCGMAAFKRHCAFGFWKHELVLGELDAKAREAMGSFGCLRTLQDLPPKAALKRYLKKAVQLNEDGVKAPRQKTRPKTALRVPDDLSAALKRNAKARATFEAFSPSHKREYVAWITGAKRAETRARRLATAIGWMAQGKPHNWKYAKR
jgi:uncharacterized protein YdeI (YjbR/CyaY-like superfamily)